MTAATIAVEIRFGPLYGKASLSIDIPADTPEKLRLKAAVVLAVKAKNDLRGAYLSGAYLRGADLSGADLSGADLSGADLSGADLSGAYLSGADLSGAYLSGADLSGADLRGAYLRGADLSGAYLSGADLRGADLSGADLSGADLSGADLRGAYLSGAYLRGAYLRGAYLRGADLSGADLSGALVDDQKLAGERPLLVIGPIGRERRDLLAFTTEAGVFVRAGCFWGTLGQFREAVAATHGDNVHGREYAAAIAMIEAHAAAWPAPITPKED